MSKRLPLLGVAVALGMGAVGVRAAAQHNPETTCPRWASEQCLPVPHVYGSLCVGTDCWQEFELCCDGSVEFHHF